MKPRESQSLTVIPASLLLAALMATSAIGKVADDERHGPVTGFWYWGLVAYESLAAALLVNRRWRTLGAWACIVLGVMGVLHALLWRPAACGCVGAIMNLTWRGELLLASLTAMLGVMAADRRPRSP